MRKVNKELVVAAQRALPWIEGATFLAHFMEFYRPTPILQGLHYRVLDRIPTLHAEDHFLQFQQRILSLSTSDQAPFLLVQPVLRLPRKNGFVDGGAGLVKPANVGIPDTHSRSAEFASGRIRSNSAMIPLSEKCRILRITMLPTQARPTHSNMNQRSGTKQQNLPCRNCAMFRA